MKVPKKLPKRQTGYFARAILYIALSAFCFTNLRQLWQLLLIFIALSAFYIYQWIKHKDDMSLAEIIKHNLGEDDEYDNTNMNKTMSKKEQKKSFQDYMEKVENDFRDDELDEELVNEEDDDFSDLYIG